uniref:Uncharacterized protein n=1 Tax=Anopheles culicifacies TaxID=139723 RepID=A0A182LRG9_9DIPT
MSPCSDDPDAITGSTGTARTIADGRYGSTTFTTTGREPSFIVDPAAIAVVVVVGSGLCCGGGSCGEPDPARADLVTAPTVRSRLGDIGNEPLFGRFIDVVVQLRSTELVLLIAVLLLLLLTLIADGIIRLVPPTPIVAVPITTDAFVVEGLTEYGCCLLPSPIGAAAVVLVAMAVVGRSFIVVFRAGRFVFTELEPTLLLVPPPVRILIGTTVSPLFVPPTTPAPVPPFPLSMPPLPLALCLDAFPEVTVIVVREGSMIVPVEEVMIVLLLMLLLLQLPLLLATFAGLMPDEAENVIACIFPIDRELGSTFAVTGCTLGGCAATAATGGCVCRATVTIVAFPLPTLLDIGTMETEGVTVLVASGVCGTGADCCAGATSTTGICEDAVTTGAPEDKAVGIGSGAGGGVGGVGLATVPAAPKNDPAYFRSPHIGSKCFNFHGSSLLFSRSASERIFSCASGVNSPSANRSRHSWHARAKNSLFNPDGFKRMPLRSHWVASGNGGRSTGGSNCTSLY